MHKKTIREYSRANPQAAEALSEWYEKVKAADWTSITDVRNDMSYADLIGGDRFIFNIKGNDYRLLAAVLFKTRTVLICGIFTHAQYSRLSKKQLLTY